MILAWSSFEEKCFVFIKYFLRKEKYLLKRVFVSVLLLLLLLLLLCLKMLIFVLFYTRPQFFARSLYVQSYSNLANLKAFHELQGCS